MNLRALDWRARAAIETVAAAAFLLALFVQGAPGWALTLALFVATRVSRVAIAGDLAAVQSSVHELRSELVPEPESEERPT